MIEEEWRVHLAPEQAGCYGNSGECGRAVSYIAELTYCICGEAAWSEHLGEASENHAPDVETGIKLCTDCSFIVRSFPSLTAIRSLRTADVPA